MNTHLICFSDLLILNFNIFILASLVLNSVQFDQGPKSVFSFVDARTFKISIFK